MAAETILFDGKPYVVLPRDEYDRLITLAKAADLPPLPEPDENGCFPAVEYTRISLARDIIRDRRAAGLTQQELAKLARTRQETISRIESGTYSASVKLIDKIDRVLKQAAKVRERRKTRKRSTRRGTSG